VINMWDIIKEKRKGIKGPNRKRKPKMVPSNPLTGEKGKGHKPKKAESFPDWFKGLNPDRKEEIERKTEKIATSRDRHLQPKQVAPHIRPGAAGRSQRKPTTPEKSKKCAMCGVGLTRKDKVKNAHLEETDLHYCSLCNDIKEGRSKPIPHSTLDTRYWTSRWANRRRNTRGKMRRNR